MPALPLQQVISNRKQLGEKWVQENQGKFVCACGCGKKIQLKWYHRNNGVLSYIPGHQMYKYTGKKNPNWRGGRIESHGYIYRYCPDHPKAIKGYVAEHKLFMEKHIGRYLRANETVHHINRIKNDNRLENLELTTDTKHRQHHNRDKQNPAYRHDVSTKNIIACYLNGMKIKEICSKLKCSESLVDSRLKKAKIKRLRRNENDVITNNKN